MSEISPRLSRWIRRSAAVLVIAPLLALPGMSCTHSHYRNERFYEDIAWGIVTGLTDIYNQNISGTPAGPVDITASGPFGGTVHITGTTAYGQSIETVHLQYVLTNCRVSSTSSSSDLNVDLTLNGVIDEDGSWSASHVSLSYFSGTLDVDGFARRGREQRDVHGLTTFRANRTSSGTSAELFGFNVAW
jgi:hypothetical protein